MIANPDAPRDALIFGERGTFSSEEYPFVLEEVRCDGGRKSVLNLTAMRHRAGAEKRKDYARYQAIVAEHGPLPPSLWNIDRKDPGFQAAKEAYWTHPTIVALEVAGLISLFYGSLEENFGHDEETLVRRAEAAVVPGYATLTPAGWLAPGNMGWFGMSSDTPDTQGHYWEAANALIDRAAPDDWLVMVDAHI